MTKPVKPVNDICEFEQLLPARGNIRAFLPRRRVAELVWIWAQIEAIKTGQTGQSQTGQLQNRSERIPFKPVSP